VKPFNVKNGALCHGDVEAVRTEFQESCSPVTITPSLEDILGEIKPTRRSRLDTGGKE